MRTAIIVNTVDNLGLLRFTETKLFFDANNQHTNFVNDCVVVSSLEKANIVAESCKDSVILQTGDFLTTTFRQKYRDSTGTIVADGPDVIKFLPDTYIGFDRPCAYKQGTKQLYIIENMLKACARNKKLVYLDNTESVDTNISTKGIRHLCGLASGWKTMQLAEYIGFENLESITVFDINPMQLDYAEWIHKNVNGQSPPAYKYTCGTYNPTTVKRTTWENWSKYPVNFKIIDLFSVPVFPEHSLIWVSNAFKYESNIFDFGWKMCKNKHYSLLEVNSKSTFI